MKKLELLILALVLVAAIAIGPSGCYLEIRFDPTPTPARLAPPIGTAPQEVQREAPENQ